MEIDRTGTLYDKFLNEMEAEVADIMRKFFECSVQPFTFDHDECTHASPESFAKIIKYERGNK